MIRSDHVQPNISAHHMVSRIPELSKYIKDFLFAWSYCFAHKKQERPISVDRKICENSQFGVWKIRQTMSWAASGCNNQIKTVQTGPATTTFKIRP